MSFHGGSDRGVGRSRGSRGSRGAARAGVGKIRGRWQPRADEQPPPTRPSQPPLSTAPLGPIVNSIDVKTLMIEEEAPVIQNAKYISSYNWLDSKSSIILVPGSPPAWTPLAKDIKLNRDSGDVYRDINAAHYAVYPLEPAIRSIRAMKPNYKLQDVDIIGCGSTFGNLLRCVASQERAFRFDVNIIGDTILFIRRENSPTELIADVQGYGHTFPEKYTTWDKGVGNSCSHQRIISYDFGGLQLLVRSETDGYLKEAGITGPQNTGQSVKGEDLADAFDSMAVGKAVLSKPAKLEVRLQGIEISQDKIFDIKTRSVYRTYDMNEILPRLWLNQTPNFLIAYHKSGLFNKPKVECIHKDILQWQDKNSSVLAGLHALLKQVVDVVRDSEYEHFELSWDGEGDLLISKQIGEGRNSLPADLCELWQN